MRENYIPVLTGTTDPWPPATRAGPRASSPTAKPPSDTRAASAASSSHKTNIPKGQTGQQARTAHRPRQQDHRHRHNPGTQGPQPHLPHRHRGETPRQGHIHQNDQAQTQEANQTGKENALPPAQVQQPEPGRGLATSQHPVKTPKHPHLDQKTEQNASNHRNPRRDQCLRPPDTPQPRNQGKQYQQGPLYQTNLRSAVLTRDQNKCVYCGKSGKNNKLQLDHVVPRASNGANRYDNLVATLQGMQSAKGEHAAGNIPEEKTQEADGNQEKTRHGPRRCNPHEHHHSRTRQGLAQPRLDRHRARRRHHRSRETPLRRGEIPTRRRRSYRLSNPTKVHPRYPNHHHRHRQGQPAENRARQKWHTQGKGIPGILQTATPYTDENPHTQPQEETKTCRKRCHRRPRGLHPQRCQSARLRNHQQKRSGTHQTQVEEHQGQRRQL